MRHCPTCHRALPENVVENARIAELNAVAAGRQRRLDGGSTRESATAKEWECPFSD
jgi:hypothetical protein